ncbi:hypothetical protein Btru_067066 [Bulinus truncatus]|nr:hypothetical protein Btru_067066 [Bulinus truncatus]
MSESRAYSDQDDKHDDKYSDDFASDEERRTPTPEKTSKNQRSSHHQYYQDLFRGRGRGAGASNRSRGRLTKRGRGNSRNSEPVDMKKGHDSVTARVLSASRNKINELRNKVEELRIQIKDLEQENRLYKKLQFRQEKAIRVIEEKENDLPSILDKHNNEVRSLREQNRKLKEKYDKTDRYLRDAEDELERVKKKMNKYKEMCEQKELRERDELTRKLTTAELDIEEKMSKIKYCLFFFICLQISRFIVKVSDEELNTKAEVKDLKEQQSNLSVTDNFAQYARLQRKIDKLISAVKEKDKERKQYISYLRIGVTTGIYILHGIIMLSLMIILRSEPLLMVEASWLSPFTRIVAFPTGIPGAVGLGCWVLVSNTVIHRAKALVESFK